MKKSEYFKSLLLKQKNNPKIYKNSHCDKCFESKGLTIIGTMILCKKCKETTKGD